MNDGAKSVLMAVGITFAIRLVYDLGKKLGRKAKKEETASTAKDGGKEEASTAKDEGKEEASTAKEERKEEASTAKEEKEASESEAERILSMANDLLSQAEKLGSDDINPDTIDEAISDIMKKVDELANLTKGLLSPEEKDGLEKAISSVRYTLNMYRVL